VPTKLTRFADGVMEASWLAAVLLTPVFFNIYSSRIFEPDKIALLRSLALVALAAWLVKLLVQNRTVWSGLAPGQSRLAYLLRVPFVAPALALGLVYILSTILSVTPWVSLWGSYQRLQGTYTLFAYLVMFGVVAANLRRRAQVERLITTLILTSLPISLYGVLQRYGLDPIPWGGDVTTRSTSTLGNSIFLAAYLIMVFPLTVGRILQSFKTILLENDRGRLLSSMALGSVYIFTAGLQLIAQYFSGSRGPLLGLMAGMFFMFLLLTLQWRRRWMTFSVLGTAAALGAFLLVFNLQGGPLEALRSSPAIGRYGELLDSQSKNARVRAYIWQGAAELAAPHPPLEYPDGSPDRFNVLRPLVGYGPESMYVAFNRFYPPELGHVEKRNASPDRSHNETWDSLVITGGLGLLVYLALFAAVFYYGFKWTGLIPGPGERGWFFTILAAGGLAGAGGLYLWRGVAYLGVGLPFGMIAGLIVYLAAAAVFVRYLPAESGAESARRLVLIALMAGILAHFVEINFGIAIAATRLYFWVYLAGLLAAGWLLPKRYGDQAWQPEEGSEQKKPGEAYPTKASHKGGKKHPRGRRRMDARSSPDLGGLLHLWLIPGLVIGLLLAALGFGFIANNNREFSALPVIWGSLAPVDTQPGSSTFAFLLLFLVTWLAGALLFSTEGFLQDSRLSVRRAFGLVAGISLGVGLFFWVWHAGALAAISNLAPATLLEVRVQTAQVGQLVTRFALFGLMLVLFLGWALGAGLVDERRRATDQSRPDSKASVAQASVAQASVAQASGVKTAGKRSWHPGGSDRLGRLALIAAPILLAAALVVSHQTNLKAIHADIAFKMAENFNRPGQWQAGNYLYKYAIELAPAQDHYYLFVGRNYLESAKETSDTQAQFRLVEEARDDLLVALSMNPLNTDHTSNLARLYSWWAGRSPNPDEREEWAGLASEYYEQAIRLSPQNSTLWGEWASLFLELLDDQPGALQRLEHALSIDDQYSLTQGMMGDYYLRLARGSEPGAEKDEAYRKAIEHFRLAADLANEFEDQIRINNLAALGNVYLELGQPEAAIRVYEEAIETGPQASDLWRLEETLARVHAQYGSTPQALLHARRALAVAPPEQSERLQSLIDQLLQIP
jgi:hypothetical protein